MLPSAYPRRKDRSSLPTYLLPPLPSAFPEVDVPADIAAGTTPGAKHAAVRKLLHELGIAPGALPLDSFKFLTRLHYCAADTGAGAGAVLLLGGWAVGRLGCWAVMCVGQWDLRCRCSAEWGLLPRSAVCDRAAQLRPLLPLLWCCLQRLYRQRLPSTVGGLHAGTWGPAAEWGEHEMDYILFVRAAAPVPLEPNPEEVMVGCGRVVWDGGVGGCGMGRGRGNSGLGRVRQHSHYMIEVSRKISQVWVV